MSKHRRPPDRVSNDIHPDNPETPSPGPSDPDPPDPEASDSEASDSEAFDPAEALQSLHLEIIQIEAMANAASEAVVQLPFPSDREARRVFDRVYALVTKVADETSTAVSHGYQLITALQARLQRPKTES